MARYFFHTQTDTRSTDSDGIELDGPLQARREAIRTFGELMRDGPEGFWGSRPWSVTVTNSVGWVLWELKADGTAAPASA